MEGEKRFERMMELTGQPKNPVDGDVFYNPVADAFFIYDAGSPYSDSGWVDLSSASPDDLEKIKERYRNMAVSFEVAMEAIEMSHSRGSDGKCRAGCPGCAVRDRVETLATARRLME